MLIPKFKRQSKILRLSPEAYSRLEELAETFNMIKTGGNVSVSDFVEAIGLSQLTVDPTIKKGIYYEDGVIDGRTGEEITFDQVYGNGTNHTRSMYLAGYFDGKYHTQELEKEMKRNGTMPQ